MFPKVLRYFAISLATGLILTPDLQADDEALAPSPILRRAQNVNVFGSKKTWDKAEDANPNPEKPRDLLHIKPQSANPLGDAMGFIAPRGEDIDEPEAPDERENWLRADILKNDVQAAEAMRQYQLDKLSGTFDETSIGLAEDRETRKNTMNERAPTLDNPLRDPLNRGALDLLQKPEEELAQPERNQARIDMRPTSAARESDRGAANMQTRNEAADELATGVAGNSRYSIPSMAARGNLVDNLLSSYGNRTSTIDAMNRRYNPTMGGSSRETPENETAKAADELGGLRTTIDIDTFGFEPRENTLISGLPSRNEKAGEATIFQVGGRLTPGLRDTGRTARGGPGASFSQPGAGYASVGAAGMGRDPLTQNQRSQPSASTRLGLQPPGASKAASSFSDQAFKSHFDRDSIRLPGQR